ERIEALGFDPFAGRRISEKKSRYSARADEDLRAVGGERAPLLIDDHQPRNPVFFRFAFYPVFRLRRNRGEIDILFVGNVDDLHAVDIKTHGERGRRSCFKALVHTLGGHQGKPVPDIWSISVEQRKVREPPFMVIVTVRDDQPFDGFQAVPAELLENRGTAVYEVAAFADRHLIADALPDPGERTVITKHPD